MRWQRSQGSMGRSQGDHPSRGAGGEPRALRGLVLSPTHPTTARARRAGVGAQLDPSGGSPRNERRTGGSRGARNAAQTRVEHGPPHGDEIPGRVADGLHTLHGAPRIWPRPTRARRSPCRTTPCPPGAPCLAPRLGDHPAKCLRPSPAPPTRPRQPQDPLQACTPHTPAQTLNPQRPPRPTTQARRNSRSGTRAPRRLQRSSLESRGRHQRVRTAQRAQKHRRPGRQRVERRCPSHERTRFTSVVAA